MAGLTQHQDENRNQNQNQIEDYDSPSTRPPRKRRRPAKACDPCRRRKVRCDQELPCNQCVRAKAPLQCFYIPNAAADSPSNATVFQPGAQQTLGATPARSDLQTQTHLNDSTQLAEHGELQQQKDVIQDLQHRLRRLEEQLSGPSQSGPSQAVGPAASNLSISQSLHHLHGRVLGAEEKVSDSAHGNALSNGCSIPATLPRLRITAEKTKLFGPSHWLHTAEKLQVIGEFDAKEVEPIFQNVDANVQFTKLFKDCRRLRHTIKKQQSVHLNEPVPDLLGTLPTQPICDVLIDGYFRTFEPIYRIIHMPTFWEQYRQLWTQTQSTPTHFLMKLVLVLALGTAFYPDRSEWPHLHRLAHTWIYAAQWWLTGPSEKSTANLDGLQVGCLLILARHANNVPGMSWLSAESLLHMAVAMGLHRNPDLFPALSAYQVEMRTRLWATITELTVMASLDNAMPLPSILQDFDRTTPLNVNDHDIELNSKARPVPHPGHHLTDSSVQILLLKSLPVRMEVVRFLNNNNHQEQSYEVALRLGNELRSACRDITTFFHSSSHQSPSDRQEPSLRIQTDDFHLRFFHLYLHQYILFLHRPFMIQARKDPRFYMSRKVCLESCMVITSYAERLNLPSDTLDDLSRLTIVGRGSFKGPLRLDVITALGLEITTQLEEEAVTRSSDSSSSSPSFIADPLTQLAQTNRCPLLRRLEHIRDQLLQIIALVGNPSLKRFTFLAAILSLTRALESGRPVRPAVYETVRESLAKCYELLLRQSSRASDQSTTTMLNNNGGGSSLANGDVNPPLSTDAYLPASDVNFGIDDDHAFVQQQQAASLTNNDNNNNNSLSSPSADITTIVVIGMISVVLTFTVMVEEEVAV